MMNQDLYQERNAHREWGRRDALRNEEVVGTEEMMYVAVMLG